MSSKTRSTIEVTVVLALCVVFSQCHHQADGEDRAVAKDEPATHSSMGLPSVVGDVKGVPIYAYGRVFIHGISPDFERGVVIQHDDTRPAELNVELSTKDQKIQHCGFTLPDGSLMVAAWLPGKSADHHHGVATDMAIAVPRCRDVAGIDMLNGFEQRLLFRQENGRVVVPGLVIHDYPLMLRFTR